MTFFRDARFVATKDVHYMVRERETMIWLFVMPVVFFWFIGTVTSGFGGSRGDQKDPIAVSVPADGGFLGERVLRRLEDNDFEVVRPETGDDLASHSRRLVLPPRFTDAVLSGEKATVRLERRSAGIGQQFDTLRVGRALYTTLADVVASHEAGEEPGPDAFERLDAMPRALTLRVEPGAERVRIPTGFEQAIPGIMVMFTMIALLTSGAVLLVIERNQGLLRRLAATPIPRGGIVLGKWSGKLALGVVQIAFAMLAGTVLFGMDWGPDLPAIFVVLLAWSALCASLGMWLGNLARTEGQAVGVGVLATNVLAALGGCWWPIEITPEWMQALQKALPTGWAMDAMHRLISFRAGAGSVVPHVLVMVVGAVVVGWLAARRFRFE